jgi:hypothetical protein
MRCGEGIQAGLGAADAGDLACLHYLPAVAGRVGGRLGDWLAAGSAGGGKAAARHRGRRRPRLGV